MSMIGSGFWELSGISQTLQTTENIIWWGARQWQRLRPDAIYSAAVDAGADPTTLLRQGLIMGKATSGAGSGKLVPWTPFATDGSQNIHGVLSVDQSMLTAGVARDRWFGYCFVGGTLKAKSLLIAKASNALGLAGTTEEYFVRALLTATGRFQLDDDYRGSTNEFGAFQHASLQTDPTAITLTVAQNNTLCLANHSALTTYTLPAPKIGLKFSFYAMTDTGFDIESATAGDLIWYNDAAANKVGFKDTGETIGAWIDAICIPTTTTSTFTPKWALVSRCPMTADGAAVCDPTVVT